MMRKATTGIFRCDFFRVLHGYGIVIPVSQHVGEHLSHTTSMFKREIVLVIVLKIEKITKAGNGPCVTPTRRLPVRVSWLVCCI